MVEYRSGDKLARCVRSLRENGIDEVVVVDNDAADPLARPVAPGTDLQRVAAPHNLGFGGGVNLGAAHTDAELLLICNPDIELQPGALDHMKRCLYENPRAGAVGPALLDESGAVRQSARAFPGVRSSWQQAFLGLLRPSGRRSSEYRARNWSLAATGEVDWVTGACMLVRAEAFNRIGGFDDHYFLYVEEVDFCWRLRATGWDVLYEPRAKVTHTGGVSTSAHPYRAIATHHRSLWLFVKRTASSADRAALPLAALGLLARFGIACAMQAARSLRHAGAAVSRSGRSLE